MADKKKAEEIDLSEEQEQWLDEAWDSLANPSGEEASGQEKSLDPGGGESPTVSVEALQKADFVTLPKQVEGTNCSNCLFNSKGVCKQSTIKGQPVNERNCCAFWDNPKALREWKKKGFTGYIHKAVKPKWQK